MLIAWVGGVLTLACAATLVGSLGRTLDDTHDLWPPTSSMRVPILLFLGTCVWTAVQWMPWTPAALHHPLWADAEATLGQSLPGSISLNPGQTIASGLQLLAYGGRVRSGARPSVATPAALVLDFKFSCMRVSRMRSTA